MVADWKVQEVEKIKELAKKYKVIGVFDLFNTPATQLHEIRRKFRGKIVLKVGRKKLFERALREVGMENLLKYFDGMIGLIFTNEDPIKIYKELMKFVVPAPAKPNVPAPKDIIVPAGPTDLLPMAMGMLKRFGIKTKVEGGKIKILEDKKVLNAGEMITPELAELLNKLGIKPLELRLNIKALYDKKILYDKEALELALKDYTQDIIDAFSRAYFLALGIEYINKYTVRELIRRSYLKAISLASSVLIPEKESIVEHLKKAYRIATLLKGRINA